MLMSLKEQVMEEQKDILYSDCDIVRGDTDTEFLGSCEFCYRYETCKKAYEKEHKLLCR